MRDGADAAENVIQNQETDKSDAPAEANPGGPTLFECLINDQLDSSPGPSADPWELATEIENLAALQGANGQNGNKTESRLTELVRSASSQSIAEVLELLARQLKNTLKKSRRLEIKNERILADREQAVAFAEAALDEQQAIISKLESIDDSTDVR